MPTRLLLVLVLAISLTAFAQVSAPPAQYTSTPAAPAVVAPGTNGAVWTGVGSAGGVLLTTPEATFDSPQPTAGISLAGRAGISNSTPINTAVQTSVNTPTMVYVNLPANVEMESPAETVNPATSAVSSSSNDLLPSSFTTNIGAAPSPSGLSLAEIAARYRARQGTQTVRTYTNSDVPTENAGMLTNILLAENRLPAGARGSSATQAQPSAPAAQPPSAGTETTAQAQPQNENKLPTSASILPLLGFLGLATSGLGVLLRRYRR